MLLIAESARVSVPCVVGAQKLVHQGVGREPKKRHSNRRRLPKSDGEFCARESEAQSTAAVVRVLREVRH